MSFKEIKELRQAGKLEEALELANQAMQLDPDNIWNKRAAAWVYYDYLKKYDQSESFALFKENLIKINELQLPEDEKMVFDACAWQVGSYVFHLQKAENVDYEKINELFEIIKDFHFTKPSEAYSFIYKAFHKGYQNWSQYLSFADWWDFENFRPNDYQNEEYNGIKIMSIVEQAYIAYSKKLIDGTPIDSYGNQRQIDKEKVRLFLVKLNTLIEKRPAYQYPPYFKAKLLLVLGNEDNALSAFLPFAKQKRNNFWIWELMAEMFSEDREIQFACYCKALSLGTSEDFLVKLRQTFASILIDKEMYDEAVVEIRKVIATREKNQWKINNHIIEWTKQDWYKSASSKKSNQDLYLLHIEKAEEILYQEIPEETIVVEFVNEGKKMLNFVGDDQKFGFFKYQGHITKPQIGDILKVRLTGDRKTQFYKVLTAKTADPSTKCKAVKTIEGELKIALPNTFGFVGNVYVDPKFIEENYLINGQTVKGIAILSYNRKKDELGWKLLSLQ